MRLTLFQSLTTSQIYEWYLSILLEDMPILLGDCFTDKINSKDWVWSWRVFIELVTAWLSIFHAFVEYLNQVLLASAVHHHQVLNEEAVLDVPSAMKDSTGWVEQISQLFIVNLTERGLHVELFWLHGHLFPHVAHWPGEETIVLIRGPPLPPKLILHTRHSIGLSWASLAIGEYRSRIAL